VQRVHNGQNDVQSSEGKSPVAQYCDSGLRSFFVYRDAGVTAATNGQVLVQLVRAARRARRQGAAPASIFTPPPFMSSTWSAAGPGSTMTASIHWSRPATASISVRGSFTLSTIGRTTWSSRRSSLPADFATTEITLSAIAAAAPPTVCH
jgi:hypothetical protein